MPKHTSIINKVKNYFRENPKKSVLFLVIFIAVIFLLTRSKTPTYQFVKVTKGPIIETVSVTGNTTAVQSVSLGFGSGGTIARVLAAVGEEVYAGQLLAELNTSDLLAQLRQAQADVDTQKAKLAGLKAGAQPEDIASSKATLDKSIQDLDNLYASVVDVSSESLASANDAVRTQLSALFSNAETQSPQLTFNASDSQAAVNAQTKRFQSSTALNNWQSDIFKLSVADKKGFETSLNNSLNYLNIIRDLLVSSSLVLNSSNNLSATTLATNKASLVTAFTEVNTATKSINTLIQEIASQKLTVEKYKADLALKQSGATAEDLAAQSAQVSQAEASLAVVQSKFQNARIVAPISGVINQFDAKIGQLATANQSLVSIIGTGGFEVHAGVAETDIGKVSLGNKVQMKLDAFQNEVFEGKVFYIAPAETNNSGVINYQIKVSFDKEDARIKSGLTANLTIETRKKDAVLTLPQYAILQNDDGNFVQVLEGGKIKNVPVTLGLQDQDGNVEVITGVKQGQEVLNVGLKKI